MRKLIFTLMAFLLIAPLALAQRPGHGMRPGQGMGGAGQGRGMGFGRGPIENEKLEEMRDTLRFLRMSESRKQLKYDDEKLLMINNILDTMEANRFELLGRERDLRLTLTKATASIAERVAALEQVIDARQKIAAGEAEAWTSLKARLSDEEVLEVFVFYEKFQRDVRRRLGQLRGDGDEGQRNPRNNRQ